MPENVLRSKPYHGSIFPCAEDEVSVSCILKQFTVCSQNLKQLLCFLFLKVSDKLGQERKNYNECLENEARVSLSRTAYTELALALFQSQPPTHCKTFGMMRFEIFYTSYCNIFFVSSFVVASATTKL